MHQEEEEEEEEGLFRLVSKVTTLLEVWTGRRYAHAAGRTPKEERRKKDGKTSRE